MDVSGREEREIRLQDLNRNPKVLFAFKEYLQEDMCQIYFVAQVRFTKMKTAKKSKSIIIAIAAIIFAFIIVGFFGSVETGMNRQGSHPNDENRKNI